MSKANGGKLENFNTIKDGNGRLVLEDAEVRRIRKKYYEDLCNIDAHEQVAIHMCGFDGGRRGNYFLGKLIRRTEVEIRLGKLKNAKATCKNEVTGEMIKNEGNKVVDWIWRLCNMAFQSGVVPGDRRPAVIIPLYKGKGERTECSN